MDSVTAIGFNSDIFAPALIGGVFNAGLYGLIAVALVLSYRISRTIAFVHGGIVLAAAVTYWYFTEPNFDSGVEGVAAAIGGGERPELARWPVLIALLIAGGAISAFFGFLATSSRMANYPRVTLTNFSLALMLIIIGFVFKYNQSSGGDAPSPFGTGSKKIDVGIGETVTTHELMTLVILLVFVVIFSILLQRTRFGVYTRAVADNVEASKLVGVPIGQVGTIVYAISGAIAALAGILISATPTGTETTAILFIFLRALIVCVLGAFGSIPLALAGALLIAVIDSVMQSGVFGTPDRAIQEIVVVTILFSVVIGIDRFGKKGSSVLAH